VVKVDPIDRSPQRRVGGKVGTFERVVQGVALAVVIGVIAFVCYLADLLVTAFTH
jgi:hypothetical protein